MSTASYAGGRILLVLPIGIVCATEVGTAGVASPSVATDPSLSPPLSRLVVGVSFEPVLNTGTGALVGARPDPSPSPSFGRLVVEVSFGLVLSTEMGALVGAGA
jgi:hypothetical protein